MTYTKAVAHTFRCDRCKTSTHDGDGWVTFRLHTIGYTRGQTRRRDLCLDCATQFGDFMAKDR